MVFLRVSMARSTSLKEGELSVAVQRRGADGRKKAGKRWMGVAEWQRPKQRVFGIVYGTGRKLGLALLMVGFM